MNFLKGAQLRMTAWAIALMLCLFSNISSIPTPTPQPLSYEVKHAQAIAKLNLTRQEFNELASRFSYVLSKPVNEFSKAFVRRLTEKRENDEKNIIVSTFSIHTALSMLFFGSPKNSTTNQDLARVLGLGNEGAESQNYLFNYLYLLKFYNDARSIYDAEVEIANKIFLHKGFVPKDHFNTLLEAFYLTSTENTNFEKPEDAANLINAYVNKKTRGLIDEIISPNDVGILTRLVLVNAIYFRANWKYQFNKRLTSPMVYNLLDDQGHVTHENGMKVLANFRIGTSATLNCRILELPYESADFNMYVLIPNNNSLASLNELAINNNMTEIQSSLKSSPQDQQVQVYMPAFESTFKAGLKDTLEDMGINTLFNSADLDDISDEPLYVSDVLHKAQVKINEEGSEAAAATAVVVNTRSGGPSFRRHIEFRVDQPFVFVIHDRANNIPLFIGRIINPTGKTIERIVEDTTHKENFILLPDEAGQRHQKRKNVENSQKLSSKFNQVKESSNAYNENTTLNCIKGKLFNISSNEDAVIFPCIKNNTDADAKGDNLKRVEELKKFQELLAASKTTLYDAE